MIFIIAEYAEKNNGIISSIKQFTGNIANQSRKCILLSQGESKQPGRYLSAFLPRRYLRNIIIIKYYAGGGYLITGVSQYKVPMKWEVLPKPWAK